MGPAAALFLLLNGIVGIEWARACAIVAGISLAFIASGIFLYIYRRALELSRRLRERMSDASTAAARRCLAPIASWPPNQQGRSLRCGIGGGRRWAAWPGKPVILDDHRRDPAIRH